MKVKVKSRIPLLKRLDSELKMLESYRICAVFKRKRRDMTLLKRDLKNLTDFSKIFREYVPLIYHKVLQVRRRWLNAFRSYWRKNNGRGDSALPPQRGAG